MHVRLAPSEGHVTEADGTVGHEHFTLGECADLADLLEGLNRPNNGGSAIRRLTDLLWALQNDTSAMIITTEET